MTKPVRITLLVVVVIMLIVVLGGGTAFVMGGRLLSRTMDIPDEALESVSDSAALARGKHLATIWACTDCHTANLGGQVLIDAPVFAYVIAPNLTAGIGGLTVDYSLQRFEKAVRHGVGWDGRLLMIMPAMDYQHVTDADVAAIFAYLKSVPPVDNDVVGRKLGPFGRMASLIAGADMFPALGLVHDLVHLSTVEPSMTADYGGYLAGVCIGCHARDYAGIDGGGPNLTPDVETGLGTWTFDDFKLAFQQGRRPDGAVLDSTMPWFVFETMTQDEVEALWMYLEGLDPIVGVKREAREE